MERKILTHLRDWRNKKRRKPLILRGVRQVGKTFSLKKFGKLDFPKFHYFNFEESEELHLYFDQDLKPDRILSELQFYSNQPINSSNDLVIFDEIQACPKALTSLKYFNEEMPELAICCAGSLLGIHLNSGSFPVGKVEVMDLYPMTFFEYLHALGETLPLEFFRQWSQGQPMPLSLHRHLWELLINYFIIGGLPEAVQIFIENKNNRMIAFQEVRNKQHQLIIAYIAEIAKHSGKANAMHIERILRAIPSQLAKSQDGSAKRFQFKGVVPKVDKYSRLVSAIDWLEAAHMICKIPIINQGKLPFSAYAKESWFKLFSFDVGILGAMSHLPPKSIVDYDYGSYKGYFAENFVAQELLSSGFKTLYSWEEGRSEIEFLIEIEGRAVPLEVKSGWVARAQSLFKFQKKYASKISVILSAKEPHIEDRVLHLPLYLAGNIYRALNQFEYI